MKKVLVIDDTKNIRLLLTTCLELEGYLVTTANDGKKAYELLEAEVFDLIFLDIKLPELSGTEVLRKTREAGIETPVIIMTAFATVKNAVECTKLGAVAYLQKPFTAEKVRNILTEVESQISPNQKSIDSYLRSSWELINANKLTEAFELLKKALSANPEHGEIYDLMAKIYESQGNIINATKFHEIGQLLKNKS